MERNPGISVFVVNLDRSPSRMRWMDQQLTSLGVSYTRVPAIDGSNPEIDDEIARAGLALGKPKGRPLGGREIGCYLSHMHVFRAMQEGGMEGACILEDDVELSSDFPAVLRGLSRHFGRNVVIKLEPWQKRRMGVAVDTFGHHRTIYSPQPLSETGAYFVTRTAIEAMPDLESITQPFDHALFADRARGPLMLTLSPAVAVQTDRFPSLIQADRDLIGLMRRRMPRLWRELWRPLFQFADFIQAILRVYRRLGLGGLRNLRYQHVLTPAQASAGKRRTRPETPPSWHPDLGTQPALHGDGS